MDPKKTGTIILEARKKHNMTQKDLAEKLYVSDKAVSKWERGLCFPDISVLIPLTEILNIGLYDLLRGEKMNKKEVEEVLKDTINYSNSELKSKKKKYLFISSIIIFIIVLISVLSLLLINKNNDIKGIVDRDEIYNIIYYSDYKTTLTDTNGKKLESIIMKLPLKWKERVIEVEKNSLKILYSSSYKDVVKAYADEEYVKEAMINNATVIFTVVSDVDTFEINYSDYKYSITRKQLLDVFDISDFNDVIEKNSWTELISSKLVSDKFIDDTFKLFSKEKI